MTAIEVITGLLLLVGVWSVICRFNMMQHGVTIPRVGAQHAALGVALFVALFLPPQSAKLVLALGVVIYLIAGAPRWRNRAPVETMTAPAPLEELHDTERNPDKGD